RRVVADPHKALSAAARAIEAAGYQMLASDANSDGGVLTFKTPRSGRSWGQEVTVVVESAEGATNVSIFHKSGQLYDWGEGKKVGAKILTAVDAAAMPPD
ncbi:MAG TPA: hypothetical protein VD766_03310, partial [Solirubrobacterales bacterium]|nr:hypothetical protein [Solirubrobacterales bacterium]